MKSLPTSSCSGAAVIVAACLGLVLLSAPVSAEYRYLFDSDLTEWEVQMLLPEFGPEDFGNYIAVFQQILSTYAASHTWDGNFSFDVAQMQFQRGNLSYWHVEGLDRDTLIKAEYYSVATDGSAGSSKVGTKIKNIPAYSAPNLTNAPKNIAYKNVNEVHCLYNDQSVTWEAVNLTAGWPGKGFTTVGQFSEFFGPDFPQLLGVNASYPVVFRDQINTTLTAYWNCQFTITEWDVVPCQIQLTYEATEPNPFNELAVVVTRSGIRDPVLVEALDATMKLFEYLVKQPQIDSNVCHRNQPPTLPPGSKPPE